MQLGISQVKRIDGNFLSLRVSLLFYNRMTKKIGNFTEQFSNSWDYYLKVRFSFLIATLFLKRLT